MTINWDHPAAIELRKSIVAGIVESNIQSGMYHAVYPDGKPSKDYYNYDRAKDHSYVLAETEARVERGRGGRGPTEAAGAFI